MDLVRLWQGGSVEVINRVKNSPSIRRELFLELKKKAMRSHQIAITPGRDFDFGASEFFSRVDGLVSETLEGTAGVGSEDLSSSGSIYDLRLSYMGFRNVHHAMRFLWTLKENSSPAQYSIQLLKKPIYGFAGLEI